MACTELMMIGVSPLYITGLWLVMDRTDDEMVVSIRDINSDVLPAHLTHSRVLDNPVSIFCHTGLQGWQWFTQGKQIALLVYRNLHYFPYIWDILFFAD